MTAVRREPVDELKLSIRALQSRRDAIHISALRFPNYRNLELGAKLPFEFPITLLMGRNGTNKSSILHALYGSVAGNTIGDFWFETQIDAIPATVDGLKQSVAHTYTDGSGNTVESIKARAPRSAADPDYWEAVKPTGVYGFAPGTRRISPVQLNVLHLDFRGELPAFDKYFYFPDPKHLARRAEHARRKGKLRREYRKQDYLRRRSGILKKKLRTDGTALTDEELDLLRYILEREYVGGRVLKHDLFHGHEGWTLVFSTSGLRGYSDAFAGSGESAAALLVHNVLAAPERTLILLDEPETSLHPRAQQRLMQFLAHQAVRKSLQIVMATHSIYLAEGLPQTAIRVLGLGATGRVWISTNHSAAEALQEISTLPSGNTILVEDKRAKAVVLGALQKVSTQALQQFQIVVRSGGTSRIFRDVQAFVNAGRTDVFVVLDGDHRPEIAIPPAGQLPQGQAELKALIQELTKGPNTRGPGLDFVEEEEMTAYVEFLRRYVRYLPSNTPEELVWSVTNIEHLLGGPMPADIAGEADAKQRLRLVAKASPGLNEDSVFRVLLARLLKSDTPQARELAATIDEIRGTA